LKGNAIGNDGLFSLCQVLPLNESLVSLNLEKNQITGRGVHYFSKILEKKHKISLKKLILSKNDLSGKEGIHLVKLICENT
jgi:hypothetical protein